MNLDAAIKQRGLSDYYTPNVVREMIGEANLPKLDPALIVTLIHVSLFNYSLFDLAREIKLNENEILITLKKHGLKNMNDEFLLIARIVKAFHNLGIGKDETSKVIIPYYKEYDKLVDLLKTKWKEVNEISIITNTKKIRIKSKMLIDSILEKIVAHFLSKKVTIKFYANIEYKLKGRPKSAKTQALKKSCLLIIEYLNIKKKLMPKGRAKYSDQRRRFIADLFNDLDIDIDKNYIQTILPK